MNDSYKGVTAHFSSSTGLKPLAEPDLILQNQGSQGRRSSVFLRRELRRQADWGPNPSFKRTYHSLALQAVISFSAFRANLRQAA